MRWKGWDRVPLEIPDPADPSKKKQVVALAPLIISASRSTDIPAFYGDWLLSRIAAGYAKWNSPFGGQPVYLSFAKARVFAFWSKNPAPFQSPLDELERRGYGSIFLVTLNDYEKEGLEPGLPPLAERVATFIHLAQRTGPGRIVWRFDPLLLSDTISVDDLLDRIQDIGDRIHPFTRRLVISFIDIAKYGKVKRNLLAAGYGGIREVTDHEVTALAEGLLALNRRWDLTITACGEGRDLIPRGIGHGECIGYDMLLTEFSHDPDLMKFLAGPGHLKRSVPLHQKPLSKLLKDPGQRSTCGCIVSKDIGQYSTCPHGCVYCYANASFTRAKRNYRTYRTSAQQGIFNDCIIP